MGEPDLWRQQRERTEAAATAMLSNLRALAGAGPHGEEARLAEKSDRERWIAGVKQRLGIITIGECICLHGSDGFTIPMGCPLHDPFLTALHDPFHAGGQQFTGLDDLIRGYPVQVSVISDHTVTLPPGWPPECRCVLMDGEQVSLSGPCPAHSP